MPESECEENYSRHCRRKHKKREMSPDSYREYKKKRKSRKQRSNERFDDQKRHKVKEESKECVRIKSETKDRHEKGHLRHVKTEPREDDDCEPRNARLEPSSSKKEQRGDRRGRKDGDSNDWGKNTSRGKSGKAKAADPQKPNFSLSGKLAEDTNIFNGVVIKYSEPPEARMPKKRWRLYPFKGNQGLPTLYIHRQSAYLLGRDRKVADIPIDHPSCSKQHAALQYRMVTYQRVDGSTGRQIRLYIIDLESANGTYINNNKIEPRKYVELFEKDVIKFGFSSREYVLLHEHSKDDNESENES